MAFKFELVGGEKLLRALKDAPETLRKEIAGEIEGSARIIEGDAAAAAPTDDSTLWKGIQANPVSELVWTVSSNANYSAYVEFGTGSFAAAYVSGLPEDVQTYARHFYVNGEGRLPAHPFLFPAFEREKIELVKNIKNVLKDLI